MNDSLNIKDGLLEQTMTKEVFNHFKEGVTPLPKKITEATSVAELNSFFPPSQKGEMSFSCRLSDSPLLEGISERIKENSFNSLEELGETIFNNIIHVVDKEELVGKDIILLVNNGEKLQESITEENGLMVLRRSIRGYIPEMVGLIFRKYFATGTIFYLLPDGTRIPADPPINNWG